MIENVKITDTQLGISDHGFLTCYIACEGDGWGCHYGGYALDTYNVKTDTRTGVDISVIRVILEVLGVESWEDLKGIYIRCEHEGLGGKITKIGHLIKDKWFSFDEYFREV